MSLDPRDALQSLTSALEEHLAAASTRRGDEDPSVEAAYLGIIDAFEVYEEVLYNAYNEVTPLVVYEEDDELEDDGANQSGDIDDEDLDPIDD
ncbi:hypothetical protein IV498_13595 [Paenarthrobacter sp. Z7-10]|uniref:hypothetical protein n=1 Tax=Paenarthrobacter sp. Z7-10 TaxID=2787635 RepID=UPI0022A8F154|nr:hypothetical protein [Paenarthrobacter sp. Z7-10]MCZ2404185.1 hypothetical protein [Paenarthrobacter sp. Z7-10]